jgi:hypothetical protein
MFSAHYKNLAGKEVTATARVGGMDAACPVDAPCNTPIVARKH